MKPKISIITLAVSDIERSTSFYRDGLGLPTYGNFPGITFFELSGTWLMEEARKAGALVQKPAKDMDWGGYSGYFSDPDGFLWEVAWNPHFDLT